MSEPTQRRADYPGREELSDAIDDFRRQLARLNRESTRHGDSASGPNAIRPKMAELITEAIITLDRLTAAGLMAERQSVLRREASAAKAAQTPGPGIADLLAERAARRPPAARRD